MRRLARASFAGSNEGTGSSRGRFRRAFAALTALGSLALVMALALVPAASAAPWGFEKVTPDDKGAGVVSAADTFDASPDGNSLLYTTTLPFDSVPTESVPLYLRYLGLRGTSGWDTKVSDPPYYIHEEAGTVVAFLIMTTVRSSRDQSHAIVISRYALTPGATEGGSNVYVRNLHTGAYEYLIATSPSRQIVQAGKTNQGATAYRYLANDGRAALFQSSTPLLPSVTGATLYKWTAEDGLEAVTQLPASKGGAVVSGTTVGGTENGTREPLGFNDSTDRVFFYVLTAPNSGAYVRENGETRLVSYSRIAPEGETPEEKEARLETPVAARVNAVSDGGQFAVLTTASRLTENTPVASFGGANYLYRYDISNDSLTYIGYGYNNTEVFRMTQDGQTIAFKTTTVDGRGSFYVWRNGSTRFVATQEAGSVATTNARFLRQLSENGRYFVFTDNSNSLAATFGYDNTNAAACPGSGSFFVAACDEVYVYDADAVGGKLSCASCRPDGGLPLGRAGDPRSANAGFTRLNDHQMRNVADDGTVFFTTVDGLLPLQDSNGLEDVYAWKDGDLRLVSHGTQGASSRFLDATPDGKTVFISSSDQLTPEDTDHAVDIYMTREGAGFPYTPPVITSDCAGIEVCHDGPSARHSQPSAGSASFQGRGNETGAEASGEVTVTKPKAAKGATATLRVKVPGKGKVTVTGGGVMKATKSAAKAGTVTVKVTLKPAVRKALESSGQVKEKVTVTFRAGDGSSSSKRVQITYGSQASQKVGRQS